MSGQVNFVINNKTYHMRFDNMIEHGVNCSSEVSLGQSNKHFCLDGRKVLQTLETKLFNFDWGKFV